MIAKYLDNYKQASTSGGEREGNEKRELNTFIVYLYWTYAPVVLAQEQQQKEAKVTFFEDFTGRIENGTMVLHFNHSWTHAQKNDIDYISEGLKFKNNGTVILK
jgi:hypothetical protein